MNIVLCDTSCDSKCGLFVDTIAIITNTTAFHPLEVQPFNYTHKTDL